jgi:vanillate O-demethylase monooxygenase subunit
MGLNLVRMVLTRALVRLEVARDASLLGQLGDTDVSLKGRSLGRFDKALRATRKRIERIYRGRAG